MNKCIGRIAGRGGSPRRLFLDQLDSLDPLPRRCVIFEADAHQGIAVFLRKSFGSRLSCLEYQPRFHAILRNQSVHYSYFNTRLFRPLLPAGDEADFFLRFFFDDHYLPDCLENYLKLPVKLYFQ